jgi:tetratricopeptide (TPR) repeat protein
MARKDRKKKKSPPAVRLSGEVAQAAILLEQRNYDEAGRLLDVLERRRPRDPEVCELQIELAHHTDDPRGYEEAVDRLIALRPRDKELQARLGSARLMNGRPAAALVAYREFLRRFPGHPVAQAVWPEAKELEKIVPKVLEELGLTGPDALEVAALHDESMALLERGEFAHARRVAGQVLAARPGFVSALNNTATSYALEGNYERSAEFCRKALEADPTNGFAAANLARTLFLSGDYAAARAAAVGLPDREFRFAEHAHKAAEALATLGDDAGVLAVCERGLNRWPDEPPAAGMQHLAAVAEYRLGRESAARQRWEKALRIMPGYPLAVANLDDLERPVGERHAAFPLDVGSWIPVSHVEYLQARMTSAKGRDDAVRREARRFLEANPAAAALIPALLDRGDSRGRIWALMLASLAETPPMLEALRDFALSQRGPDAMRVQAAQVALQAGLIPAGPTRMWVDGAWTDIVLMGIEIINEPMTKHPPAVAEMLTRAHELLSRGDGRAAEPILRRALEREPDSPDILNNLAAALGLQGYDDQANEMVKSIHERFPDYWFARVSVARMAINDRDFDKATELLLPLMQRPRAHFSEFAALAQAQIDLHLARGETEAARQWYQLWEQAVPDHPALPEWRERVMAPPRRGWSLGGWWKKR